MRDLDTTLREDKAITENNQLGVNSSAYRPGRYSTQEKRISEFADWYMGKRQTTVMASAG
ncbi:SRPBCC family protein [Nitratireductor sp. GCM10026969]|uniref:SRPBCC family protein n=1 Tax=Nitratireductor sp. GCM10026969 TaxID=3252645 RepID=UPI003616F36D